MKLTRYKYYGQPDPGLEEDDKGRYVLAAEAQAQIDLLRTALEDVVRPCVGEPREDCSHCRARAALDQTKP